MSLAAIRPARAQDAFEQIERARTAFQEQRHAEVLALLEPLVGGATAAVRGLAEREARKYLGASYVMLNREEQAEQQFTELLADHPEHTLDSNAFPPDVLTTFAVVQARVRQQGTRQEYEEQLAETRAELEREREARAQLSRQVEALRPLAAEEIVEVESSRWIALLPFGAGQFQNQRPALAAFFLVSELLLAGASIGLFAWHQVLARNNVIEEVDEPRWLRLERAARISNVVAFSGFLGLAAIGIAEAQLRFVPVRRTTRTRSLPVELDVGLTGVGLRVRF